MGKNRQKANLTSNNLITSDITNDRIGINSTSPTATLDVVGIVSATSFYGDGSSLSNIISGVGIQSGGTSIASEASTINFVGTGITMADDGSVTDITIPTMSRTATRVVATDAQTAFTVAAYDSPLIDVYLNGVKLDSTEYATTNSTTITLTTGASTGDIFESVSYSNFTGVNVTSANSATTATTATNVTVADESSDTTCFPLFATAATGDLPPKTDASALTYNASTGNLSATIVSDASGSLRNLPQNAQTSAYTLVASDTGKHISITTGGVTVPSGIFSVGDIVTIYNNSSSSQTITQGSSVTLRQAGTSNTGNRSLDQYGTSTLLCVASNVFVISGSGLG